MSFLRRRKQQIIDIEAPLFMWTRCRRCHSYECELMDAVLIIDARKCTPSRGQWYDFTWEVRLESGESITSSHTYSEKQVEAAKRDCETAYLKWRGMLRVRA